MNRKWTHTTAEMCCRKKLPVWKKFTEEFVLWRNDLTREIYCGEVLLEKFYWRRFTGEIVLEKFYWRNFTGEVLLEKFHWRSFTGEILLEKVHRRNFTGEVLWEKFYWRSFTGEISLEKFYWRNFPGEFLLEKVELLCDACEDMWLRAEYTETSVERGRKSESWSGGEVLLENFLLEKFYSNFLLRKFYWRIFTRENFAGKALLGNIFAEWIVNLFVGHVMGNISLYGCPWFKTEGERRRHKKLRNRQGEEHRTDKRTTNKRKCTPTNINAH